MHINTRIKQLEREAHKKAHKYMKIEIEIGEWCCDIGSSCKKCKDRPKLKLKEYVNGELIINVGAD